MPQFIIQLVCRRHTFTYEKIDITTANLYTDYQRYPKTQNQTFYERNVKTRVCKYLRSSLSGR